MGESIYLLNRLHASSIFKLLELLVDIVKSLKVFTFCVLYLFRLAEDIHVKLNGHIELYLRPLWLTSFKIFFIICCSNLLSICIIQRENNLIYRSNSQSRQYIHSVSSWKILMHILINRIYIQGSAEIINALIHLNQMLSFKNSE